MSWLGGRHAMVNKMAKYSPVPTDLLGLARGIEIKISQD